MPFLRLRIGLYAAVVAAIFVLASYKLYRGNDARTPQKDEVLIKAMLQGLSAVHYQPEQIDDNFSRRVYDLSLKRIDYSKKFLLQSDIAQLRKYQTDLDDQVRRGSHEFVDLSTQLLKQRTKDVQALYRDLLSKPMDFTVDESYQSDPDKAQFPADAAAQREEWRKYLKYQTLIRLAEIQEEQAKRDPKKASTPALSATEMEAEARKRVLKNFDEQFNDLMQTDDNDRLALWANTIANTYDPHTEYYAPRDKEAFDIELTGRFEGIGATLQQKDGQIKVADIVPGSASYRQGQLKVGDVIQRVAQGAAEPISIEGMRLDKAISYIRGPKGTEVRLTVKKADGSIQIIPITRDVVILEDRFAQSATIDNAGKKVGYIHLPTFYADFNDNGGRSSAEDVKRELEKLSHENVQGVILDLRNNGGGSLTDAVEMSGLFIENGPVVQVRSPQGAAQVLNDRDSRVQYGGPLVVLVNKNSASASEILAAAIQDYKRGVIMGSTSTYGKGTVQRIINLDDALPAEFNAIKPFGSLKLTTQKFYRINGGSTQFKGVTPDILLPGADSYLDQGEKDADYPLKWDEISPARYRAWNQPPAIDKLRAASAARVAASPSFKTVQDIVARMRKRKDDTVVSLKLASFLAEQEKAKAESKRYEESQKAAVALNIAPLPVDLRAVQSDTVKQNRVRRLSKNLVKDINLREAVAVINDQLSAAVTKR
ncbi:tail-specific protease [Hymenobacter busanensis]|uniref:Tail-specific protease n=1 Tax=Hymenobacter busanensis TaxID=2607656 RepID=A0A7L4ZWT2_9BACT|nr:carboxy terminal-processing peptidase [Hymenobacter busanensis]KAA9332347.1 tail-specific protease [Hymenobacter busanensis]QHJ07316.1 tail-specific protease [Hymenobacter busanensis]